MGHVVRGIGWRGAAIAACGLALALGLWQWTARSQAGVYMHCPPVVTKAGKARFSKAFVLIVKRDEVDCEKARKTIYHALSAKPYANRRIRGWTCKSTRRAGRSASYGAICVKQGRREVIRSTTPRPCNDCRHVRD
jgi:hypothetical protein